MPDLGGIYNEAAQELSGTPDRNPVIVIPGILGSRLETPDGQVVWGQFGRGSVNPRTEEGIALMSLPADGSDDGVRAVGVIDRFSLNLWGGLGFQQAAYENLLKTLGVGGYIDRDMNYNPSDSVDYGEEHFTCFQFPYDWRRELSESAIALHAFIETEREVVRRRRIGLFGAEAVEAAGPIKFDVVAHSMGGLVLRYYLMYGPTPLDEVPDTPTWAGAKYIDKAIFVGTPHGGSVEALRTLIEGKRFAPILPHYPARVLQSYPSMFQLVPTHELWRIPVGARKDALPLETLERHVDMAERFHAAIRVEADPPANLRQYLFVADAIQTADKLGPDLRTVASAPGDQTVTRDAAILDRDPGPLLDSPIPWDRIQFLHTDHLGMTQDPGFTDNMLFLLLIQK
ncbi:MAG: hypothetical protein AAGD32_01240 [Planctomycetota bacterium]